MASQYLTGDSAIERSFVIEALRTIVLEDKQELLKLYAENLTNSCGWHRCLQYAASIHATAPFAKVVLASPLELRPSTRRLYESALTKERMILGALDNVLQESLELLTENNIPLILLKGMDVGRRFYPNRILRPMTDVDILVPASQFERSIALLQSKGYQVIGPRISGRKQIELARSADSAVVELHSHLITAKTSQELQSVWDRARIFNLEFGSASVRVLSDLDLLLLLIRHGFVQHLLESPIWLNDICIILRQVSTQESPIWNALIGEAAKKKFSTALWFCLELAKSYGRLAIPESVMHSASKQVAGWRRSSLRTQFFQTVDHAWFGWEPRSTIWKMRTRFLLRDSASEAVLYALRRARTGGWTRA